ncbi:uncharacterized protein ACRADG_001635 [Cochliomyia hominivorax]
MAAQCTPRKPTRMARRVKSVCCPAPTTKTTPTTDSPPPKVAKRCQRPGPKQRNPYLNFLRDFRKRCCGLSPIETIRQGAKAWKSLSMEDRQRFIVEAFYTRKRPVQSRATHRSRAGCRGRLRRRGRSARSSRTRSRKRHRTRIC